MSTSSNRSSSTDSKLPSSDPLIRWLLLTLHFVFLTMWIPFEIFRRKSLQRFHHHTVAEDLCGAAFMTAIFGLLLISPFYLHSHRRIAVSGLFLGIAGLTYCMLVPTHL